VNREFCTLPSPSMTLCWTTTQVIGFLHLAQVDSQFGRSEILHIADDREIIRNISLAARSYNEGGRTLKC
jgi:hypothetical protein